MAGIRREARKIFKAQLGSLLKWSKRLFTDEDGEGHSKRFDGLMYNVSKSPQRYEGIYDHSRNRSASESRQLRHEHRVKQRRHATRSRR